MWLRDGSGTKLSQRDNLPVLPARPSGLHGHCVGRGSSSRSVNSTCPAVEDTVQQPAHTRGYRDFEATAELLPAGPNE